MSGWTESNPLAKCQTQQPCRIQQRNVEPCSRGTTPQSNMGWGNQEGFGWANRTGAGMAPLKQLRLTTHSAWAAAEKSAASRLAEMIIPFWMAARCVQFWGLPVQQRLTNQREPSQGLLRWQAGCSMWWTVTPRTSLFSLQKRQRGI